MKYTFMQYKIQMCTSINQNNYLKYLPEILKAQFKF